MITRDTLEEKQISIYIITLILSMLVGMGWNGSSSLEQLIEPIIAILLYSMFCQIPFLALKDVFKNKSFFKALLIGNFIFIPILVWILISIFPTAPILTLGVLLVLLTPCIDYVIVFSHLGKGNSQAILAATPILFVLQMLLLPLYLWLFLGKEAMHIIDPTPFIHAFLFLIIIPFALSILTQLYAKSNLRLGLKVLNFSAWLPVPFMAGTFFVVIASQITVVYENSASIWSILPIYICYALLAPLIGKFSSRIFNVDYFSARAVSFSTSTRNSLVVLPLALALPAPENQLVALIIVAQTIVEIFFELIYIKVIPLLIPSKAKAE